jgi:hypothetical protein
MGPWRARECRYVAEMGTASACDSGETPSGNPGRLGGEGSPITWQPPVALLARRHSLPSPHGPASPASARLGNLRPQCRKWRAATTRHETGRAVATGAYGFPSFRLRFTFLFGVRNVKNFLATACSSCYNWKDNSTALNEPLQPLIASRPHL